MCEESIDNGSVEERRSRRYSAKKHLYLVYSVPPSVEFSSPALEQHNFDALVADILIEVERFCLSVKRTSPAELPLWPAAGSVDTLLS